MLALPGEFGGRLDLAVAASGALCWIGGLDRWAGSAASTLRPGGRLVVVDLHSCTTTWSTGSIAHAGLSDADVGPRYFDHPGSYAGPEADIGATATVRRAHSLGRWSPLWPGPGCAWTGWSSTCQPRSTIVGRARVRADGRWRLPVDGQDVPALLALEAGKPAG